LAGEVECYFAFGHVSTQLFFIDSRSSFEEYSSTGATITSTTGTGLIDGNGQPYWNIFATNSSYRRPCLMDVENSKSITVKSLTFKNAPNVFHCIGGGSSNLLYDHVTLTAARASSGATADPKNTDGFDVGLSTSVTIQNTVVTNQDDCVAFKSGCNGVTVTNITCTGSHGLSVGSLAGGAGSHDVVQNVFVNGANMINSAKAVGIKLYQGMCLLFYDAFFQ
jgi:galacturan 1,4-alpha-galacturonidase